MAGGASVYALTHPEGPRMEGRSHDETASMAENPPEPSTVPAPLTGHEVEPEEAERPVTGVMLENSPNARPQSGLDAADIVFEAISEGGITRFLALYQSNIPSQVGSVRSVRPYFVDWIMGFDAPIAHVGGSPTALAMIERRGTKDLDQFSHPGPFFRTGDRPAPHNMFARMNELRDLQNSLGYTSSEFREFEWQDGEVASEVEADSIVIDYSSQQYQARFDFQPDSNTYNRSMAGQQHRDALTNDVISVDNVIVVYMRVERVGQNTHVGTFHGGEALVFNNGKVTQANWEQENPINRIQVVDDHGEQIPLNRGDTWIAVVPTDRTVSY